jgi:hypothetical protein
MGSYLSTPITEKHSDDGVGDGLSYGVSEMQGWRVGTGAREAAGAQGAHLSPWASSCAPPSSPYGVQSICPLGCSECLLTLVRPLAERTFPPAGRDGGRLHRQPDLPAGERC